MAGAQPTIDAELQSMLRILNVFKRNGKSMKIIRHLPYLLFLDFGVLTQYLTGINLGEIGFPFPCGSGSRIHPKRKACRQKQVATSHTAPIRRKERKWGYKTSRPTTSSKHPSLDGSASFPNSTTCWRQSVQMHKPMENISHSDVNSIIRSCF